MLRMLVGRRSALAGLMVAGLAVGTTASAAVGRIEASFGVGPNGGPSYVIPIRATDGIGGMTPRLAVSYLDPEHRGILGTGFGLAGLSAITPCPKTIAQDSIAAAVTLTSADRYCLDGARLRLVAGTYGASGATYRTEIDQLARVTSYASTSNVPGYFRVERTDGLTYEYGNTADSLVRTSTSGAARTQFWALNKIADRAGNALTFHYDNDDAAHKFRPSLIQYTNRSATPDGHYTVEFVYQGSNQPDPSTSYQSSSGEAAYLIQNRLLQRLDLKHQGTTYRQYLFNYGTSANGNSRLTSVEECAATPSDCLAPTTFTWQDGTPGHDSLLASSAAASAPQPLDLNNDGYEDLVWAESGTWRSMLGGASGYASPSNTGIAATNPTKAMVLDWNGDGFEDLLVDWSDGKWRVLRGTATGLASAQHAGPGAGIPSNTAASAWYVADINGDGRDDLLRVRTTTTQLLKIWVRLGGATGFGTETVALDSPYFRPTAQLLGSNAERFRARTRRADFNGDGREDLMARVCEWDAELSMCLSTGWVQLFSQGTSLVSIAYGASDITYNERPQYGHFNDDNLTDFVYRSSYTGNWTVATSKGEAGFGTSAGPTASGYLTYLYLVADYDGDGFDDLYAARTATGTWSIIEGGTGSVTATSLATTGGSWTVTDHDGDGLDDLGTFTSSAWRTSSHSGLPADVLASATDGFGNAVTFGYLPMSDPLVYTRGSGATYPVQDFGDFSSLVRTLQVSPGGGTAYTLTYAYANARRHVQGRGFLGMGSRTVTDGRNGIYTTETYRQDFPYIGAPATVTTQQSGGTTIESATHTYTAHTLDATANNQRYLPYRSQTVTNAYEVAGTRNSDWITQVTDARTVNTLGNTTAATVTTVDKDSGSSEYGFAYTTAVTATYKEDTTYWCLAVPTSRSETRTLPDATAQTRSTSWTVSGLECRVTQEIIEPGQGSTLSLVTDLGYDGCGNLNSTSSYPAGLAGQARTTSIGYGSRCQAPESVTNALNQTSTLGYDYALGVPTTQTDPNGIAVTTTYDSFGRPTRVLRPDGTATRVALTACTAGNGYCGKDSSVRLKATQTERDVYDATLRTDEQYLDGLGRVRWAHSDTLESGPALVETQYDAFGRVSQRSQPRLAAGATYWTTFQYDLLGRLTQQNAPVSEGVTAGRITAYAYEGRDLRVTDPRGYSTTRTAKVTGQMRVVVDPSPGGTTTYAYKPFGELASITDAATPGNTTSWNYNLRGFVTQTVDPDAGTWTYTPNAFGELVTQVNAKSQSTTFTYDKLSRPLTRVEAEGTTTWTWGQLSDNGASNKYVGRLKTISSPGGYSESYVYDGLGRPAQQTVNADGSNYVINLGYSAATGQPSSLTYPTSVGTYRLTLGYEYQNGLLKRIRDAGSGGTVVFWEVTSTDAWGHIQDEAFGNGVDTFTDFDQANGWMEARQGGLGGGTGLIHATTNWDLNGNLTQRQDLKQSVTETFTHDALNRFDVSQRNGTINQDVTLDAIGNITWKLGVGSYSYHATKKRAVVSAGSNTYGYDANGNMTSRNGSSIGYTSYDLPNVINAGSNSSTLSYGAFRNRFKQVANTGGTYETTIYVGGILEKVTRGSVTEYRHLIHGGKGVAAIHTRRSDATVSTFYVHSDHLGSPELITDEAGGSEVKLSFGAYGERRGSSWTGSPSAGDLATIGNTSRHGFTGHEHLDAVGLIHMNGRVYDPVVGRFLSADPVLDLGLGAQSANRYAYVGNSPLSFVDPSGFSCLPPEGATDEEASAEMDRCSAEFESGGWGPSNGNQSRWCLELGIGCRNTLQDLLDLDVTGGGGTNFGEAPLSADVQQSFDRYSRMVDSSRSPRGVIELQGLCTLSEAECLDALGDGAEYAVGGAVATIGFGRAAAWNSRRLGPYGWASTADELVESISRTTRGAFGVASRLNIAAQAMLIANDLVHDDLPGALYGLADFGAGVLAVKATGPIAGSIVAIGYSHFGGTEAIVNEYARVFVTVQHQLRSEHDRFLQGVYSGDRRFPR